MANSFVVDTGKAQQVSERLTSAGRSIEGLPPGPQPGGPLGSGVLERAWSEFEKSVATARQNLARSVTESASGFAALASGATDLDQQQARDVSSLHGK